MDLRKHIEDFLLRKGWVSRVEHVEFLAAGEYNENYRVQADGRLYVFRINHGSQLGLSNQIEYEYRVLKSLENSGVTPRPFDYMLDTDIPGDGVLLMEYIPGEPLEYEKDFDEAARIFAAVHSQPLSADLIVQRRPVFDIAAESLGLIERFEDHPLKEQRQRLRTYHREVLRLGEATEKLFDDEQPCIVNTEVNSRNFVMRGTPHGGPRGFLVDWEKAVVSCRYQDLGHFVVPTTTLWKSEFTFDGERRLRFLETYQSCINLGLSLEELSMKTEVLEKTILLRALSWCFMAYYEYSREGRTLTNRDTFEKIQMYMENMECFLSSNQ
jgi:aminoglycoside phosphotransferase (APT) family kinase protein